MKIRSGVFAGLVGAASLFAGPVANAAPILDQSNAVISDDGLNDSLEWQQQVTAGISGKLAGVTLFTQFANDTDNVEIGLGTAFSNGPFLFSGSELITTTGTFIDTSAADIMLTAGETFVIDVSGGPGCCNLSAGSPYAGGDLFLNDDGSVSDYSAYGDGLAFETFVDPNTASVPEPSSLPILLMGLGFLGVLAFVRKKKAAIKA